MVATGPMQTFCRFDLRTSDPARAREFYSQLLGHDRATVWQLHEQAVARGAKPHWLGRIGVTELERVTANFVARGAAQLGPTQTMADGGRATVLRDPGGAVVSVGTAPTAEVDIGIVWHVLNSRDATKAVTNYVELFGWSPTSSADAGAHGPFRNFAWQAGGADVGAIGDVANRPGVHPHWLFFFEVSSLADSMNAVRAGGGVVVEPMTLPDGRRVCVCDDPQGAAFGLRES